MAVKSRPKAHFTIVVASLVLCCVTAPNIFADAAGNAEISAELNNDNVEINGKGVPPSVDVKIASTWGEETSIDNVKSDPAGF